MAASKQPPSVPPFLTARNAAEHLGVAERTIRRAIARGELHAVKQSGAFQISSADLERFWSARSGADGVAAGDPGSGRGASTAGQHERTRAIKDSLPVPLTSLVGRDREIAALAAALRGRDRLLTLTGPGGVGKTRLAMAAAIAVADEFPDGVGFVALGAIGAPRLVPQTIAHVLGVHEAGEESIATRLESALRDRQVLLVLDNFEHLIEAAPLVSALLAACPYLKVLVTSRVRLRISGERESPVPPLDVESSPRPAVESTPSPAGELFIERARAVWEDHDFTADQTTIEAICRRLDGLPLAIELAAARINVLPPSDLLARLEQRLPLLTGGPRDAPARLRTMRDAIAWSYDLLRDDEQALFRRLAVFVDDFTLETAEAVGGEGGDAKLGGSGGEHDPERSRPVHGASNLPTPLRPAGPTLPSTLDLVAALVEKSLLQTTVISGGVARYGMLETVREFGLEELAICGEADAVLQRHAAWYLAFAEDAGPRAKQPGSAPWVEVLEREHPNLRAAMTWFLNRRDGPALVRMAGALWPFWHEQTYFAEGHRWLEVALDLGHAAPAADRIAALTGAGTLAWYQARIEQALAWHEQALALAREAGDRAAEAFSLINLSGPAMEFGDYDLAFTRLEAGLRAARAVGATEAASLALHNLGCLAWLQGEYQTSQQRAKEALALAQADGWDWLVPSILVNDGLATADLGDFDRAASLLREGLALGHARGNLWDVGTALEGLARVRAGSGKTRQAAKLFGAASALRDEAGLPQSHTDRAYYGPFLTALHEELGAASFAAAWADGRAMSWQAAMAGELASSPGPDQMAIPADPDPTGTHGLTRREMEILRLLATGESNRAIGKRLFISATTVASHLTNIYSKLGVETRAKAIAFAHRHDLA